MEGSCPLCSERVADPSASKVASLADPGVPSNGDCRIVTSEVCGHKLCTQCLESLCPEVTGRWVRRFKCPFCGVETAKNVWSAKDTAEDKLCQEKLVRAKVAAIHNRGRSRFENTPAYNDYLERREFTIYQLTFGSDEAEKKALNAELDDFEREHQEEIVENVKKRENELRKKVIDIVQKEGTFYEIVQQDFGPGFRYSTAKEELLHPLQLAHPEYFCEDIDVTDVPASRPRPLQLGIEYESIVKHVSLDRAAVLRACGHFRETLGRRVKEEFFGGMMLA